MSSLIKGPLDGAAAVRELTAGDCRECDNTGKLPDYRGGGVRSCACAPGIIRPAPLPTTADVENDGDRGPRASTDQALAPKRQKPFPMPGTVWRWLGHPDFDPKPSAPKRVESLRWFRGRVEAMFVGGESCAGVEHLMGSDAWEHYPETEPVRPSRDPIASIDAAAQGQHARAMVDLVAASLGLHVDEVRVLTKIAGARPLGLTWGAWRPPPRRRLNVTSTARLAGAGKVHLTIDLDVDGKPCAVWVEVHKEGSIVRGMLDCVAALASQALQHGASIQEVSGRMIGVRFEPDGAVEDHETVTRCLSIVDLLGQMIEAEFPAAEVLRDEVARRMGGGE